MAEPAQTRYTRCRYVVGDVLTDIMREYLMHSKIPLTTIYMSIMGDHKFRKKLKQREIGQIQTLESLGFADCDISLMFKIARYHKFAMITLDDPSHGWDLFPLETDNTFCDNILRIKNCRNEITHSPSTALSENEFNKNFKMYIDIGRRADEHLSKNNNHFTRRIENYKTCSLDKEMEEKYRGEIETLKKLVESNPRPDTTVKTYATKETQTKIDAIRAEELFEETSSAKITVSGIENAAKKAKQLNDQKDNFKTDYIEMKKATDGSLVLFLMINNRLFKDDNMMESELERFVKNLFVTADLQCIQNHQCNIVLELEDAESDTEESENEDDIVLHVEIKNGAFKTDESLSQKLDQFISNVVTKANGKPASCHNEVTAMLDISNKERNSEDSTQCEEKLKDEAKASENNIPDDMKEISQFLIKNELQHLKEKFESEEITIPALLQMDDVDLKEIGIKKGPRVLLLAKAKELQEKTAVDTKYQFEAKIDDVDKFLKSLNLQYLEDCFKRQDVTINALREMDADDLVYIGVDDILTRSKILDATKALKPSQEMEESDTSDLSKFLHGIGLQKLTTKFEDEEISIEALIRMTDEDLKEIDIKKKGPRVLLLKSANKVKMLRQKTDIKIGQQLKKGEYENQQTIEKEVEKNMDEVRTLLKEIKLEELYSLFEKEEITLQELFEMGHEELNSIGIKQFGRRQRIMTAVRKREDSLFDDQSVEEYESIDDIQHLRHDKTSSRDLPPVPPRQFIQELDNHQGSEKIKERSKYQTLPHPGFGYERIRSLSYQDLATDTQMAQSALSKTIFPRDSRMAQSALNLSKTMPAKPIRKYRRRTAKDSVDILLSKIADFKHKAKNSLLQSYIDIQSLIKNKRLSADVKDELSVEFGDIEKVISESLKDLDDDFCPIVITGETSAGKSSFVNLLLGVELLPKHSLTCTSTICRIYNKEEKSIVLISGKEYIKELVLQGDTDTAEVQDLLRKHGSKPVSSPTEKENIPDEGIDELKYIDINWPIPALQEHMLIVDTPGIGPDNPELTERLYQYLPKALAFIYVINTPNAGGIQSDRILQIRDVLMKQNQEEHISVFDPERAIFICNKWDQIHEEPDNVFQMVQDTLDECWIGFDPDKLYRLSAREEMQNSLDDKPVSQDFTDILKGIERMIPATTREKYHRHLHWQRKFIERLLMKLSTRIRNSHKSKQDKKEMRENIRKRIQYVKENLSLKKQAVQSKAKTHCKEIAKNVFDHFQSKDTFDTVFKWAEDDLPNHGSIQEIKRVIDKLAFDYITQELRKKIQETEVSKLREMIEQLFKSECFSIDRECETIDGILLGEEETCISRKINAADRSTSFELSDIGLTGTKGKILLAVSSPFILAFGLILLPVGVTYAISDKLNNEMKLSKYNSNRIDFANKRAVKLLTKLSVQVLTTTIEESLLKKINCRIKEFFDKEIPRRINAGDKLMENISKDLRQPREIRKHSYSMQKDVMPVYGRIIFASMDVFDENIIEADHIAGTNVIATIQLNNEKITVAVKSMRYKENSNDKYTATAEVYSMRDLHHQNVVKFYGICPLSDHGLEGFDLFTEYCGENLDNKVFDEHIRWRKSLHYIKDGLEGLIYLHQSGIVHRNIRLAAILIKDGEAKLSDGGITMRRVLKGNITGGVPIVRAPEVLLVDYCGHESDMFQVGIVLWEAFYSKRAFFDKNVKTTYEELIKRIVDGERPSLEDPYPQTTIRHKIEDCWEKSLDQRPSAKDVRDVITALLETNPIAN